MRLGLPACALAADHRYPARGPAGARVSRAGTKVLFTCPMEGDSYGLETPSPRALGVLGPSRPVAMHQRSAWSATGWVAFEGLRGSLRRADRPSVGMLSGAVWHEPLARLPSL